MNSPGPSQSLDLGTRPSHTPRMETGGPAGLTAPRETESGFPHAHRPSTQAAVCMSSVSVCMSVSVCVCA